MAFGEGSCASGAKSRDARVRELCGRIKARVAALRIRPAEHLRLLPESSTEKERIDGRLIILNTYADPTPSGELIVVVQGFLPTWRFPNYIGIAGIGRMYAEGLVVSPQGGVRDAEGQDMWGYR